jgi:hypothetical protein
VLPWERELVEVNHLEVRVREGGFSEEGEGEHREGSSLHLRTHQQMCQLVLVAGSGWCHSDLVFTEASLQHKWNILFMAVLTRDGMKHLKDSQHFPTDSYF